MTFPAQQYMACESREELSDRLSKLFRENPDLRKSVGHYRIGPFSEGYCGVRFTSDNKGKLALVSEMLIN